MGEYNMIYSCRGGKWNIDWKIGSGPVRGNSEINFEKQCKGINLMDKKLC